MTENRWDRVTALFHAALERPPEQRAGFLDEACREDPPLRGEVERLLASHDQAGSFLSAPAVAELRSDDQSDTKHGAVPVRLTPGTRLARYEIVALLGAGGMGEVYRARDPRLRREVAIKILPPEVATDPDRLRRFEQEAHAAAALNHPNITAIYDVGFVDGTAFLVSELLQGETLRDKLRGGALPVRSAVEYAIQIARGLAEAHQKGIVHRDVKPENIFVTSDGSVKILDFGIAKVTRADTEEAATTATGTLSGVMIGTVGYMSPEQVRGGQIDHRSDIFAFGAVLYEMLAGGRAFTGTSPADTLSAILQHEPAALPFGVTAQVPAFAHIVRRCLEKAPDARFQSATEVGVALDTIRAGDLKSGTASHGLIQSWAPRFHGRTYALILCTVAVLAVMSAISLLRDKPVQALTERDSILVTEFRNTTGEAVFNDILQEGLAVKLEESPFLNVVPDQAVLETLRQMGREPTEAVSGPVAQELCERRGVKAMVNGSIDKVGTQYVVAASAVNCATGEIIARDQARATGQDRVLDALDQVATDLRAKLGESLVSIRQFNTPLEQATTTSLEALKAFTLGDHDRARGRGTDAIAAYARAIELDPDFALAYARLATMYANLAETERARHYATEAYQRRDRVTERERFYIASRYHHTVNEDFAQAAETYRLWKRTYPRDFTPVNNLAVIYGVTGRFDEALVEATEAARLAPTNPVPVLLLGMINLGLNRIREAEASLDTSLKLAPDFFGARLRLFQVAFINQDSAAMDAQLAWARNKPEEPTLRHQMARALAFSGSLRRATDEFDRAADLATRLKLHDVFARITADKALVQAAVGYAREARASAEIAMNRSRTRSAMYLAVIALSLAGATAPAEALIAETSTRFPRDTSMNFVWLPTARAALEIAGGRPQEAIRTLEAARNYELGWDSSYMPTYVRGLAHLAAREPRPAHDTFTKILDHRGVDPTSPLYALAHLGVARAAALEGDLKGSLGAYDGFLSLWKNADSDVPILKEARTEAEAVRKKLRVIPPTGVARGGLRR